MISLFECQGHKYFIQHDSTLMNPLSMLQAEQKISKQQPINIIQNNIPIKNLVYRIFNSYSISNILQYLSEDFYKGQENYSNNFSNILPSGINEDSLLFFPNESIQQNTDILSIEEYSKVSNFLNLNNCYELSYPNSLYVASDQNVHYFNSVMAQPYTYFSSYSVTSSGFSFTVNQFFNLGYYVDDLDFSKYDCLHILISSIPEIQKDILSHKEQIKNDYMYAAYNIFNYLEQKLDAIKQITFNNLNSCFIV